MFLRSTVILFALGVPVGSAAAQGLLFELGSPTDASVPYAAATAAAGDVNGDAVPDVIVGIPSVLGSGSWSGRLEVRSGDDGHLIGSVTGAVGERVGAGATSAGDVDDDGTPDVATFAFEEGAWEVRVLSGDDLSVLREYQGPAGLAHPMGLARVGDVDGDGVLDLAIAYDDGVRVHSGADGGVLLAFSDFEWWSMAGLDDLDGDGHGDLAFGRRSDAGGFVSVVSGADGTTMHEEGLELGLEQFGRRVADAGDVDGDGAHDLLVGVPRGIGEGKGTVRLVSGIDGTLIRKWTSETPDPNDVGNDGFGSALCGVGDVDGDDVPDVLLGACDDESPGGAEAGRATVHSGKTGQAIFTLYGDSKAHEFGIAVAGLGDTTGDGVPDLLVSLGSSSLPDVHARAFSGRGGDFVPGQELVGSLVPQFGEPDTDEAWFLGMKGTRLKVKATVLSGDLKPRVTVMDGKGTFLAKLEFDPADPKTESYRLKKTGVFRLRMRGLKKGGQPTTGSYRVDTKWKLPKKWTELSVKKKAKAGEAIEVPFHALPGTQLDGLVVLKKGYVASPGAFLLRPSGEEVDLAPFLTPQDGAFAISGVPLAEFGEYRLRIPAGTEGKSKVKVELLLAPPAGIGEHAVP